MPTFFDKKRINPTTFLRTHTHISIYLQYTLMRHMYKLRPHLSVQLYAISTPRNWWVMLIIILLQGISIKSYATPGTDYEALRALYLNTNGDNWINNIGWPDATTFTANPTIPPGTDMSTWFGVMVNGSGCVTDLNMDGNNLVGTLPADLGNVANLRVIDLPNNMLTGNIPAAYGNLSALEYLVLNNNQLSGAIPTSLGNLSNLLYLVLEFNQLTGNIPAELGDLANLQTLDLDFNQLSGAIPPDLGDLSNLIVLSIDFNLLSGNLPANLGNLSNVQVMSFNFNQLTGSIPASFANLSSILILNISLNQMSGCYDPALSFLCTQLLPTSSTNFSISDGNNFDAPWESFCNLGTGACPCLTITCPLGMIAFTDLGACDAIISIPPLTTSGCAAASITNDFTNTADASGVYPLGNTAVTYTVTDIDGGVATCSLNITVLDNEDPLLICPADITVSTDVGFCDAFVTIPPAIAADCDLFTVVNDYTNVADASATYPLGTTTVIYTVSDASGNMTTCSFTVTVEDTEDPLISCPADITIGTGPGATNTVVTWTTPLIRDNCMVNTVTSTSNSGDTFPVGVSTVAYTVTDDSGNTATCDFLITVVNSNCENINGAIDQYTGSLMSGNVFINNNLSNWFVSHGTPDFDGNKFGYIWSSNSVGEGVYTSYNFDMGKTYEITFDVSMNSGALPGGILYVRATNNLSPVNGSFSFPIPSTAGSELVYTQNWSPTGWNTITVNYTPMTNKTQLWFYPFLVAAASTGPEQAIIQLDNLCINEVNTCPATLTVNNVPILDGLYQAGQTVNSAGQVPANGAVLFKAGQQILLDNGFSADEQADFSAEIEGCPNVGGN